MFRQRIVLFFGAMLSAATCPVQGQPIANQPVPANLAVPSGNTAFLKASASGSQNYVCLPSGTGLQWKFQGPQATLFVKFRWMNGEVRQQVTTHFLSPNPAESGLARATWQSSIDTSTVWAKKVAESNDPAFVTPGAIPWLLLQTAGTADGPMGGSFLSQTTYIQRVNTIGGNVASQDCTEAGALQFVPYTTDYIFYRASGSR
ncbi:MAG: DUF3455 domain-containing protein [Bryobacterales bacterium]|nr:DUF3455 domain-containing protein [Bryobacterales bacterium]